MYMCMKCQNSKIDRVMTNSSSLVVISSIDIAITQPHSLLSHGFGSTSLYFHKLIARTIDVPNMLRFSTSLST